MEPSLASVLLPGNTAADDAVRSLGGKTTLFAAAHEEVDAYLQRLASFSLERLRSEPAALRTESSSLEEQIESYTCGRSRRRRCCRRRAAWWWWRWSCICCCCRPCC